MKVLVVGSVPPPRTAHRQSLLDAVLRLRAAGAEVRVMSLDPLAAAHGFLIGPGLPAAAEVGLLARGFGAVVVQIEPGLPVRRGAGRLERSVALLTLAAMLRRHGDVTLRLHQFDDLPGGPGGRAAIELWKTARRMEVGNSVVAEQLVGLVPELSGRLSIIPGAAEPAAVDSGRHDGGEDRWGAGADATAAQVQDVVRRRAAEYREALAARRPAGRPRTPETRVPLWEWLPARGAGVPDLGPVRQSARRRESEQSLPPRPRSARQLASATLALAERRRLTRPAAQLTRLALAEIRGVTRR